MSNRLQKERAASSLNIEKLVEYLHGGQEEHQLHKQALEYVLNNTYFLDEDYGYYDRSRADKRKQSMAVIKKIKEILEDIPDEKLAKKVLSVIAYTKLGTLNRYSLSVLFAGNGIAGQGTKEQADFYIPKLQNLQMTACYGITELATGSYIKAFQTTATFIHETDEFEVHTPNLLATKWWVGDAAQTATHGVVIAKLVIDGQDLGAHNFIVPLRDENFQLLKGIKLGDVGPKRGSDCTDNGWMQFDRVRIPRTNMLMKWSQVDRDGKYTKGAAVQISYGTLVTGRVLIARAVVENTKKAIAIAARYTIVRDQYTMEGKGLLDYMVQQERIIGGLSAAYAYQIATESLTKYYFQVERELAEKNVTNLKELHNNAAAMKGFVALWGSKTMNECIMALGGHGFSELSEIPNILVDAAPTIPYEGDAVVLVQQTASYLVKSAADIFMGKPIEGQSIQYLQNLTKLSSLKGDQNPTEKLTLDEIKHAAAWLSMTLIKDAGLELNKKITELGDADVAWNECQLKMIQASKAHFMFMVIEMFQRELETNLPKNLGKSAQELIPILTNLAELFGARHIQEFMNVFYENGYFQLTRGKLLNTQILDLYKTIRPHVAHLVDAWDFHDRELATPFGKFDGEIYEKYFQVVNELPQDIVPSYWKDYLNLDFT